MNIQLDMSQIYKYASKFDAMTMRERALISVAALGVLLLLWNMVLMQPLTAREKALQDELDGISTDMSNTAQAMEEAMGPTNTALAQIKAAQSELADIDNQLSTTIAGMIPPQHMAQVVRDVLQQQHGLILISLRNMPVMPLVDTSAQASSADNADSKATTQKNGPFVHPLEVVVEGSYADIVAYLKALETMKWHVYWNELELETKHYPVNRVRIEMSTLSLDDTWMGV